MGKIKKKEHYSQKNFLSANLPNAILRLFLNEAAYAKRAFVATICSIVVTGSNTDICDVDVRRICILELEACQVPRAFDACGRLHTHRSLITVT